MDKKALVGEMIPVRIQTLLNEKWLDLPTLLSADEESPLHNERNKAGIFYAESWALTHMLFLSPEYRPQFAKRVQTLAAGEGPDVAFQKNHSKTLKERKEERQPILP